MKRKISVIFFIIYLQSEWWDINNNYKTFGGNSNNIMKDEFVSHYEETKVRCVDGNDEFEAYKSYDAVALLNGGICTIHNTDPPSPSTKIKLMCENAYNNNNANDTAEYEWERQKQEVNECVTDKLATEYDTDTIGCNNSYNTVYYHNQWTGTVVPNGCTPTIIAFIIIIIVSYYLYLYLYYMHSIFIILSVFTVFVFVNVNGENMMQKIIATDGTAGDHFGRTVSIHNNIAVIGAAWDDGESGSAYIFEKTNTDWIQTAKLVADDGAANDLFGYHVSIQNNIALITARDDDDRGSRSGSAYIFEKTNSSWIQITKLVPDDGAANDLFGWEAAIDDNIIVVGAPANLVGGRAGSAYIFEKSNSSWIQTAKLVPDDGFANNHFGLPVSIYNNIVLVGARGDVIGSNPGSAYIFEKTNSSSWIQTAKLVADDGSAGDYFGGSVSIQNNIAVIGAPWDDDMGGQSGSAYIFEKINTSWIQTAKLVADDGAAGDWFGGSVSMDNNVAVINAYLDDDHGSESGAAYIFQKINTSWIQTAKLVPDDGAAGDWFGYHVSIDNNTILVGSRLDDASKGSAYVVNNYDSCFDIFNEAINRDKNVDYIYNTSNNYLIHYVWTPCIFTRDPTAVPTTVPTEPSAAPTTPPFFIHFLFFFYFNSFVIF